MVTVLVVVAAGYVYRFTDWIVPPRIQVDVTTRPVRGGVPEGAVLTPVFMLDREAPLTSIRVVAVSNVPPGVLGKVAWQVTRPPGREPVRGFLFDDSLPGAMVVSKAQPLVPGGVYRVDVAAGRLRGQRDFVARAASDTAPAE